MINNETVGLIIPCHNEEQGLKVLLPQVPAEIDDVLVIDNNSSDATAQVAKAHGARVIFELSPGYGQAYRAGFGATVTDIVVTLDGDGQYPIEQVPRLVRHFQQRQLDFLSATRFPLGHSPMSVTRQLGNTLLTATANVLFRKHLSDTQSGMWIFRPVLLPNITLTQAGMAFSEELKIKTIVAGYRFEETHIPYHHRRGTSKLLPMKDGLANLLYLFRLWWQSTPNRDPRKPQHQSKQTKPKGPTQN